MRGQRRFYVDIMQSPSEVTGSFILCVAKINDKTIKFVIDCGMYQERDMESHNGRFPVKPNEVEFMVLTHNHVDHNGRIPFFVKCGFSGNIDTSNVTREIIPKAMYDNAKVVKDVCKRWNMQPLYTSEDVEKTIPQVKGIDFNTPTRVNENITVTLIPNGHLIGAASVLVQIHAPGEHKDINLFFSGDYNNKNLFFKVAPVRKWISQLPLNIIIESTYGKMDSNDIKRTFRRNVLRAIKAGKTIIVPVFSLGRAQEILYVFRDLKKKNKDLFQDIPIYYDGKLSLYYTIMYSKLQQKGLLHFYPDKKEFLPEELTYVVGPTMRKIIVEDQTRCKVIITTSGMGSYGPAQTYIPAFIGNPKALIHFTGYCAEGTLGYNLKNAPKGDIVEVGGTKAIKRADVEFTNEFSAHAKADQLIKFLKRFEKPLFIMVNHGEDSTKEAFSDRILREVDVKNVAILGREYFYRVNEYGFVKSLPTKFL